jgi:predicted Fe-Mo cluster-binding NifX family protein
MKIVFTLLGDGRDGRIDRRFGRADTFLVYDSETDHRETIANAGIDAAHGAGLKAAEAVVRLGAVALVTGECGVKALHALRHAGVKVYSTNSSTFEDALAEFRAGSLSEAHPA